MRVLIESGQDVLRAVQRKSVRAKGLAVALYHPVLAVKISAEMLVPLERTSKNQNLEFVCSVVGYPFDQQDSAEEVSM